MKRPRSVSQTRTRSPGLTRTRASQTSASLAGVWERVNGKSLRLLIWQWGYPLTEPASKPRTK